jgi:hypothetical protein
MDKEINFLPMKLFILYKSRFLLKINSNIYIPFKINLIIKS